MTIVNQPFGNQPSSSAPAPAPAPAQTVEDEAPKPLTEVAPGVFYDDAAAQASGYEPPEFSGPMDFLGQLVTGKLIGKYPPADAYRLPENAAEAAELREESESAYTAARAIRMDAKALEFDGKFNPEGDEVSKLINDAAALGQGQFYLADTDEQAENALENLFGEGNVRIIRDEGPFFNAFDARRYVSVRRPSDGTFTDFEPTTVSFTDYAKRVAPGLLAEVGASSAVVGTAFLASTAVAAASGPFAVVTAPTMFVYTLYTGGKSIEMGRQYLQDELGLNDEEAIEFSNFLDAAKEAATPRPFSLTRDDISDEQRARELSGLLETVFTVVPGLKAKLRLYSDRARSTPGVLSRADLDKEELFASAKSAAGTIDQTAAGGTLDIGVPLESLMLQQTTSNRIIARLAALAEQTSTILPRKQQAQMQSVVEYLTTYGNRVGKGDFNQYKNAVASLGERLETVKNTPDSILPQNLSDIGENIGSLEDLFLKLRGIQARGMYANVFDKLGGASYDLKDIRNLLPGKRTIVPTTPADATAKTPGKVAGELPTPERGEQIIDNLITDLLSVGRVQKDGTRILTPAQIEAAARDFAEKNPEFTFDVKTIDTPAKLLQVYASRFGQLSKDQFGEFGATYNPKLQARAIKIRNELLDLIGKPREEIKDIEQIRVDLGEANAFYRQTDEMTSQSLQVAARRGRKGPTGEEPADIAETVGTTPSAKGRSAPAVATLENINAQEAYVREFLNNPDNIEALAKSTELGDLIDAGAPAMDKLRTYFANVFSHKLSRTLPGDPSDLTQPSDVIDFLDSFDPKQLELLGIDRGMQDQIREDAREAAQLQVAGMLKEVSEAPDNAQIADLFELALSGNSLDVNKRINELMGVVKKAADPDEALRRKQQLRAGLLNHIFSVDKGIFDPVVSNSAFAEVGQTTLNVKKFATVMNQLKRAKVFGDGDANLLTKDDEIVLDAMLEYAGVINRQGADAGSALAGAQIIGELFTLDPFKFVSGIARLASQRRLSALFADDDFVKLATGIRKPMSAKERLRIMFAGKTAMGAIIARVAMTQTDARQNLDEQTDAMLATPPQGSGIPNDPFGAVFP